MKKFSFGIFILFDTPVKSDSFFQISENYTHLSAGYNNLLFTPVGV